MAKFINPVVPDSPITSMFGDADQPRDLKNYITGKVLGDSNSIISTVSNMFEFTPESDAFIWSDSKRKEIDKRNKDATKLDLPNHYMMQAMQSNETLDKILPDIDTSTITPEQLENARYYFSIVGDEEELKFNLEQQPEVVKQWENDFDYVSRNLDQAVDIAKDSLPDVGISFWDAQNMTSKDYTLFASPETRYAINRKNLDNFFY